MLYLVFCASPTHGALHERVGVLERPLSWEEGGVEWDEVVWDLRGVTRLMGWTVHVNALVMGSEADVVAEKGVAGGVSKGVFFVGRERDVVRRDSVG